MVLGILIFICFSGALSSAGAGIVTIEIDASATAVPAIPLEALGAAIDGGQKGDTDQAFQPSSVKEMASLPFYRATYRLRTELDGEVWHWNEQGTWSDSGRNQGYWVSSDQAEKPIRVSNGFKLPRRGNTHDQANLDGYSRLTDGDEASFWKSNPYLDKHFIGGDDAAYPQWIIVNFEKRTRIDGLRILWGDPYATAYEVQYFEGGRA